MQYPRISWLMGAMLGMMVYVVVGVSATVMPMAPEVGYASIAKLFGMMALLMAFPIVPVILSMKLVRWRPYVMWMIGRRLKRTPRLLRNEHRRLRSISIMLWGWTFLALFGPAAMIFARAPHFGYFNAESAMLIGSVVAWSMIVGGFVQRKGHDLVCVICDYPWRLDDPQRCPECGLNRVPPHGLRLGVRDRKWWLVGVGFALMTLTVVVRVMSM